MGKYQKNPIASGRRQRTFTGDEIMKTKGSSAVKAHKFVGLRELEKLIGRKKQDKILPKKSSAGDACKTSGVRELEKLIGRKIEPYELNEISQQDRCLERERLDRKAKPEPKATPPVKASSASEQPTSELVVLTDKQNKTYPSQAANRAETHLDSDENHNSKTFEFEVPQPKNVETDIANECNVNTVPVIEASACSAKTVTMETSNVPTETKLVVNTDHIPMETIDIPIETADALLANFDLFAEDVNELPSRHQNLRTKPAKREVFQISWSKRSKGNDGTKMEITPSTSDQKPKSQEKPKKEPSKLTVQNLDTTIEPLATSTPLKTGKKLGHMRMAAQAVKEQSTDTSESSPSHDSGFVEGEMSAGLDDGTRRIANPIEIGDQIAQALDETRDQIHQAPGEVRVQIPKVSDEARVIGTLSVQEKDPMEYQLVWGRLAQQPWWPGIVVSGKTCGLHTAQQGSAWVLWFGDHKVSCIQQLKIIPFAESFAERIQSSKNKGKLFQTAVLESLQEHARRCCYAWQEEQVADCKESDRELLYCWAADGFKVKHQQTSAISHKHNVDPLPAWICHRLAELRSMNRPKEAYTVREVTEEEEEEVVPLRIEKANPDGRFSFIRAGKIPISEVCLACEGDEVTEQHPYFEGGLCQPCKEDMMESMFVFGEDGLNMFCVICSNAGELFVCDHTVCGRVYCTGCITLLVAPDAVDNIRSMDKWLCFLCVESDNHSGLLRRKSNWRDNVIRMFQPTYSQIDVSPFAGGRPLRVLSLFDGIATGRLVLDMLGLEVELYAASEIDDDAIMVTQVRHGDNIQHIGDVQAVGSEKLKELCPIDLVIGGSPCNELSIVNPARKGLEGGTGLLFFEYFRVLNEVRLANKGRHLFWLFENSSYLPKDTKATISRFFGCEPALWDAKYFSGQKRARYFWGNIPGMYCPQQLFETQMEESLDSSLMGARKAMVSKIRTVTTRTNSLMQGKDEASFPVRMGDRGDTMWIPELESVFGFPEHYTDVANLPPTRRQKLIGKAWSLHVMKHLLNPLKQFFTLTKRD